MFGCIRCDFLSTLAEASLRRLAFQGDQRSCELSGTPGFSTLGGGEGLRRKFLPESTLLNSAQKPAPKNRAGFCTLRRIGDSNP